MNWRRQSLGSDGQHQFAGECILSKEVIAQLSFKEVKQILLDLKKNVRKEGGLNYLQVYVNTNNQEKIWIVDELDIEQLAKGRYATQVNKFTVFFPREIKRTPQ